MVWKGSPKAKNVTDSCKQAWDRAVEKTFPEPWFKFKNPLQVVDGDKEEAEWMADDSNINLLSAQVPQQWVKHWFQECQQEWVKHYTS